jgi:hypothetical protein
VGTTVITLTCGGGRAGGAASLLQPMTVAASRAAAHIRDTKVSGIVIGRGLKRAPIVRDRKSMGQ